MIEVIQAKQIRFSLKESFPTREPIIYDYLIPFLLFLIFPKPQKNFSFPIESCRA